MDLPAARQGGGGLLSAWPGARLANSTLPAPPHRDRMTPERFGQLLARPALLSGQNATELEELIGRYPWCGPLRRLRYEKALLEGDAPGIALWRGRAEPYLQRAARRERERELSVASPARAVRHFGFDTPPPAPPGEPARATPDLPPAYPPEPDLDILAAAAVAAEGVETVEWYLRRTGHDDMPPGRLTPTPKESLDSYRAWKERRANTSWGDLLTFGSPDRSKRKRGGRVRAEAARKPEVASETLAELLAAQGHTDKAVRMYRQLASRYPSRQAAFAARIEQLQQTPAPWPPS